MVLLSKAIAILLESPSTINGCDMTQRDLLVQRLGRIEYSAALALQKETEQAVLSGAQPDTLLLLEHPHVITVGRRGDNSGVLMPAELLRARAVDNAVA